MDEQERGHVRVESSDDALSHPRFILRAGDKYYLTLAVWEYDPHHPDITEEQRRGVARIAELYERLLRSERPHGPSVEVPEAEAFFFQHTH